MKTSRHIELHSTLLSAALNNIFNIAFYLTSNIQMNEKPVTI